MEPEACIAMLLAIIAKAASAYQIKRSLYRRGREHA